MSVAERASSGPATEERSLSGWGRSAQSRCSVVRVRATGEVVEFLGNRAHAERGVIARGAARSYGDAAQNEGGDVLDMTALDRILSIDRQQRTVRAQAGATIAQVMAALAPHGLTLPVVPGTRHVTIAGA